MSVDRDVRWLARGEHAVPPGEDWLTPHERARLAQLRYTKRRTEYLLRRLAAKHAVAVALGLPPGELSRIEVGNHPSGAPFVLVDGGPVGVDMSISDRAGWAVCLVGDGTGDGAVGCDLELVEPRTPGFVRDFLTGGEQAYVAAHPEPDAAANLLWSAKESALKVLRTGLRRDTRSVHVTIHSGQRVDGWAPLRVRAVEGVTFPGWWRRDGVFLFTVASGQPVPPPVALEDPGVLATAVPVHSWLARPV